jgi:peptidoglycan glycosyltransferase
VAVDPETGRVLAMVSYSRDPQLRSSENLALRATFPSASIFKVVTAAAAIAEKRFSAETRIPFSGGNHTLYRRNVLSESSGRWSRQMSLRDAFARSVNTVFGKIGAFAVGPEKLRTYAYRFGFNQPILSDLPVESGKAWISDDRFEVAESASGYTQNNTMSPLQGALIAAAIVNDGKMMQPFFVRSLHASDGTLVYEAKPELLSQAVDLTTAREMRELMRGTIVSGTSRKGFRGFFRSGFQGVDVGGKTGSLTGTSPPGKYDWFVGYGELGGRKIALSALTVNGKFWKVKSSYLARKAIETHFRELSAQARRARGSAVAAR